MGGRADERVEVDPFDGGIGQVATQALLEKVEMARPTGVGRAISTCTIPIEGRDEWLAAARRLA
jgi:hypothetical protein